MGQRLAVMRDMLDKVMPGDAACAGDVRQAEIAAGKAARALGGEQALALLDAGLGSLRGRRFALVYHEDQVDGDVLEAALNAATDTLDKSGKAGGQGSERRRWLKANGVWANAPDGDGFVLYDPRAQAPVLDNKGEWFRVRLEDCRA